MGGKLNFAILAGFCASAASLFGKLSGLPTFEGLFIVRIIFFALMIICNAGVWTLFVKALQNVESSLTATVISAASNYCLSALTGFLIFGEVTTLLWWSGMFLIICGLLLILRDQPNEHTLNKSN
ncbi:transmembrane protein 42 isoform X1 [Tribolium madens]|uniref:transmembrane protein 42 isoform X1 n=1 Tax=Tribolium madens TaxID=41895 RepID=UPI001CF74689|nr:transmembrane protein 42 isoform X1 [Tribolium madens]